MRYRDTEGNDTLIGTAADDIFLIAGGQDVVQGGGGYDRLVVDYGDLPTDFSNTFSSIAIPRDGSMSGAFAGSGGDRPGVSFSEIDSIRFDGSGGYDYLDVTKRDDALSDIKVEAGAGGYDVLFLSFRGTAPISVSVASDGDSMISVAGRYSGFEVASVRLAGGDDRYEGGDRFDEIFGRAGDDVIDGGGSDDIVNGGLGRDLLTGGDGGDIFAFARVAESLADAPDVIADFNAGDLDLIDLRLIDADSTIKGDQAFRFIDQAAFSGAGASGGELRQQIDDDGTVTLQGDVNRDGVADFAIVVTTAVPVTAADLVL